MTRHRQARRRPSRRVAIACLSVTLVALVAGAALRAERAAAAERTTAIALEHRARAEADLHEVERAEADLLAAARREHSRSAEVALREAATAQAAAAAADAAAAAADAAATTPAPRSQSASPAPASPGVPVWVTSIPTADGDGSNGHMPASAMCLIGWGTDEIGSPQYLRCDAAGALTRLNDAFRAQFGESLAMDLTYRSYEEQVAIRAVFGGVAAEPGTSNHGLGLALDVQEWPDVYGFDTPRYAWLVANGPTFGWSAPASVRADAAYPEYWHFEYAP